MTNLLAVETSGFEGSLAFLVDGVVQEERSLAAEGRRNAQTLVSEAASLLRDHDVKPREVDAVAVSYGPGSFTGLRVGITFAKTFCWANHAKLIAVDTFLALANRVDRSNPVTTVIGDAQRSELFINEYSLNADGFRQPLGEVRIETLEELISRPAGSVGVVTGPAVSKHGEKLPEAFVTAQESQRIPSAAAVAETGYELFKSEVFADPYEQEPLYIRRSYAEEKANS